MARDLATPTPPATPIPYPHTGNRADDVGQVQTLLNATPDAAEAGAFQFNPEPHTDAPNGGGLVFQSYALFPHALRDPDIGILSTEANERGVASAEFDAGSMTQKHADTGTVETAPADLAANGGDAEASTSGVIPKKIGMTRIFTAEDAGHPRILIADEPVTEGPDGSDANAGDAFHFNFQEAPETSGFEGAAAPDAFRVVADDAYAGSSAASAGQMPIAADYRHGGGESGLSVEDDLDVASLPDTAIDLF